MVTSLNQTHAFFSSHWLKTLLHPNPTRHHSISIVRHLRSITWSLRELRHRLIQPRFILLVHIFAINGAVPATAKLTVQRACFCLQASQEFRANSLLTEPLSHGRSESGPFRHLPATSSPRMVVTRRLAKLFSIFAIIYGRIFASFFFFLRDVVPAHTLTQPQTRESTRNQ